MAGMAGSDDVMVVLDRPEALFEAPPADPLAPGFALSTGMERILAAVSARSGSQRARTALVVRVGEAGPAASERIVAGIRRYAVVRRADLDLRRLALRREGVQTLWLALALIVVCVLLSMLLEAGGWDGLIGTLLQDGLLVAGWVALWRPLDLLLFDTWLIRREKRILDAVAVMPVRVETLAE